MVIFSVPACRIGCETIPNTRLIHPCIGRCLPRQGQSACTAMPRRFRGVAVIIPSSHVSDLPPLVAMHCDATKSVKNLVPLKALLATRLATATPRHRRDCLLAG